MVICDGAIARYGLTQSTAPTLEPVTAQDVALRPPDTATLAGLFDRLDFKSWKRELEEAGGVKPQVLQEYKEVDQRDAFLAKELDDL